MAALAEDPQPRSGQVPSELAALDKIAADIMAKHHLPGAQLAIAKEGRLVFSRSYGYADVEGKEPVQVDSLFRIASVSKPITAVAVLTLVERGYLRLDDKAFRILNDLKPPKGTVVDPRLFDITVLDLLQHAGGWDGSKSFDPISLPWSRMAAATLGEPDPPDGKTLVRFMMGMPLDFEPGTQIAYSNFGFVALGRVIERVASARTGKAVSYEDYVQSAVLRPAGITRMRIAGTRANERVKNEVRYYPHPNWSELPHTTLSVYPGEGYVPWAYGGYSLRGSDASGGWLGTAVDLVRFTAAIDGQRGSALLRPETVKMMVDTPTPRKPKAGDVNATTPTGIGWSTKRVGQGFNANHAGALQGSGASLLLRRHDGTILAFICNSLPPNYQNFFSEIFPLFDDALGAVTRWPQHDLFGSR